MRANELMINNIFHRTNKLTKEKIQIELTASCILDISANGEISSFVYEPIPLTEEWLLKFGFEFRNINKQYGWYLEVSQNRVLNWCHSEQISLEFDKEDYDYNNTLFDFNCKYINQLQNLYFALTGQELTLKQ